MPGYPCRLSMSNYRWFLAIFLGVGVHGLLFVLTWPELVTRPPEPQAIQRIAVSLAEKKVVRKKATTKTQPEKNQKKPVKPLNPVKQIVKKQAPKPQAEVKKETLPNPPVKPSIVDNPPPMPVVEELEPEQVEQSAPESIEATKSTSRETAGLVKQASPLYQLNPPPKYPRLARRRGLQGMVVLDVLVNTSGWVEELQVGRSTGYGLLDKAAIKAVRNWQFKVGTVGGIPQQMWVKVPVRFRLQ